MRLNISFLDFHDGFDPGNNLIYHMARQIFGQVHITEKIEESDVIFYSIFGRLSQDKEALALLKRKGILWIGENIRPNFSACRYSISCDFETYGGKNMRLPLWMHEIDWFSTGIGVASVNEVYDKLVRPGRLTSQMVADKKFCITIFNNMEGTRVHLYNELSKVGSITSYGRPFGNWFPTTSTYKDKIRYLSGHKFNLCPENSYFPGYYTEKCFHSKIAECIPIYMADSYLSKDFRPSSIINLYDFPVIDELVEEVERTSRDHELLARISNTPLLYTMPRLDKYMKFLYNAVSVCMMG